jgi:DNA-binding response OmpR family regulator
MRLIAATPERPRTPRESMSVLNNSRLIVLVEDSDDDAFFFERAFDAAGLHVELVRLCDGGAAVKYLDRAVSNGDDFASRALVFLDLKLPVLDGFEVLRWIRDRELALDVIVLSGSELEADIRAARQLGARDYFVKPIRPAQLKRWALAADPSPI